ncbi:MAG: 3-keto-disaccharide hydrolase, partial [Planctomycetota bacterium]
MRVKLLLPVLCFILMAAAMGCESRHQWGVHDMERPLPEVVVAGEYPCQAPSDAIVLFDGKDLSEWESAKDGGRAKWKVEDGYMEVVKETGAIRTKRAFGSCQLHVEWASPAKVSGKSQDSGNSGVYLMSKYEVQVLNTYKNRTYA